MLNSQCLFIYNSFFLLTTSLNLFFSFWFFFLLEALHYIKAPRWLKNNIWNFSSPFLPLRLHRTADSSNLFSLRFFSHYFRFVVNNPAESTFKLILIVSMWTMINQKVCSIWSKLNGNELKWREKKKIKIKEKIRWIIIKRNARCQKFCVFFSRSSFFIDSI